MTIINVVERRRRRRHKDYHNTSTVFFDSQPSKLCDVKDFTPLQQLILKKLWQKEKIDHDKQFLLLPQCFLLFSNFLLSLTDVFQRFTSCFQSLLLHILERVNPVVQILSGQIIYDHILLYTMKCPYYHNPIPHMKNLQQVTFTTSRRKHGK